jgi:hypothetical protein
MATKKQSLSPIIGDDAGNLIKAGYASNEMSKAKKSYDTEMKERPLEMGDTSFSEFLLEQATLAYIIDSGIELGEEAK